MKKIRFLSIGALLLVSLAACAKTGGAGGGGSGGGSGGGGTEQSMTVVWGQIYSAQTAFTSYTDSASGVTFAASKASGTSDPTYYHNDNENYRAVRLYKNNTFTVSISGTIKSIVLNIDVPSSDTSGNFEPMEGLVTSADRKTHTWTGSLASVTFTVSSYQRRVVSCVVTYVK